MMREGWFVAQGAVSYAIIWPWGWRLSGQEPPNVWWFAGVMFAFGAVCTGIRKLIEI